MIKTSFPRALLAFLLLLSCGIVRAESLDEEQARYAAAEFFSPASQSTRLHAKARQLVLRSNGHDKGYYIFDRPEGGVVFVADDDAIGRTVLGYTDGGSFDSNRLPVGLQDWLEQIGVLMDAVHEGKIKSSDVRRKAGRTIIAPLVKTTWNQYAPYNNLCPIVDGERCLTGCVATAMAQVLKYWEWPKHGYGEVTYDDSGCGQTLSTKLSSHTYDWKNMLSTYVNDGYAYTEAQYTAIATLMRDCGYAVHMNYTPTSSAANVFAETMRTYFHYNATARDRYKTKSWSWEDYPELPDDMWHEYIRQDLLARRPVLYSGKSSESGHQFVLDGFDSEDYYHANWGWGGQDDGWFMLTDLHDYNFDHRMINNLVPDYGSNDTFSYSFNSNGVLTIRGADLMSEDYQLMNAPWLDKCEQVRKIVISEGITSIAANFGYGEKDGTQYMFNNLEELVLPEGLLYIGPNAFYGANKLSSVQLPSTLINMDYAFQGCQNLKSLHLPKSLDEFNDYLPNLVELTVDEQNPYLCAKDNVLYSKSGKHLLFVPTGLDRVTISETSGDILYSNLFSGIPILSKCMNAPALPYSYYPSHSKGFLYIPYGSTGYDRWTSILPSGWRVVYYNINHIPELKISWALAEGTLTLSGWGEQKAEEYGSEAAPYYQDRSQVQKLVVEEGITSLCQKAFQGYSNLTEAELPSTLCYIYTYCFASSGITSITCHAKQAPTLSSYVFSGMPQNGTLHVPEGADYSSWLKALPSGWKIEYAPETFATCYLYTGETVSVGELANWDELLVSFPNAVGIINPRYKGWIDATHNLLIEDATAEGGYRCADFRLTDLSYNYATTDKAPITGFLPPVSFTATKGEYKRKLTEGYNTVCLPFAIEEADLPKSCRMYAYSHFDSEKGSAVFTPQSTTEAGHACFISCSKSDTEWLKDLSGMTFTTQQASTETDHMRGTFVTTEDYQSIGYSPRAKDNVFAPLDRYLHPFRACFIIDTPSAPAELRISLSDDATFFKDVMDLRNSKDIIFNLSGQRMNKAQKGVNIINGKLIIQ